uniref:Uncharacterized protein n=1 Tax=viral metagenome TaxID=1070528 RepID=A0A6C0CGK1_9ZZZZ
MERETRKVTKTRDILVMSLTARFLHPPREISTSKIRDIAFTLEESCRLAARDRGDEVYFGMVAKMITHIAPYFYSARHSMVFRDLLLEDRLKDNVGMISDPINVALAMNSFLWPEIYDNPYTDRHEKGLILDTRTVELDIALLMVKMHMKDGTQKELTLESLIDKAKVKVCFKQSTECWNQVEPTINITCGQNDATCGLYSSNTCMRYEDFIILFAKNDMSGNVLNPFDLEGTEILDPITTTRIRRVWSKEIKMARVYLDSTGE